MLLVCCQCLREEDHWGRCPQTEEGHSRELSQDHRCFPVVDLRVPETEEPYVT